MVIVGPQLELSRVSQTLKIWNSTSGGSIEAWCDSVWVGRDFNLSMCCAQKISEATKASKRKDISCVSPVSLLFLTHDRRVWCCERLLLRSASVRERLQEVVVVHAA